ncbi:MAG: DNA repair protein [Marinilabiliales bacterium]|nr:MAG: DNA repair protein [Marinilabiliales bacterium]
MKRAINIILIVLAIAAGVIIIRKRKKKQVEGLGKAVNEGRPPKVRIVYSRKQDPKLMKKITNSQDAYGILTEIWSKQIDAREEMIVLLLDRSNKVLGYDVLSMGGITGTVADLRLLFSVALNSLAVGFILCHNHPSANLNPSQSDISLTKKIKEAGLVMEISLLDHLIISKNGYYSFADEGTL